MRLPPCRAAETWTSRPVPKVTSLNETPGFPGASSLSAPPARRVFMVLRYAQPRQHSTRQWHGGDRRHIGEAAECSWCCGMRNPDNTRAEQLCARMARHQHGVFNRAQARAAGLDRHALHRRIRQGRLEPVLPRVYGIPGSPVTYERDLMAATLYTGAGTAASHRAAARMCGFDGFGRAPLEISTVSRKRSCPVKLPDGQEVTIHRVDRHMLSDIVVLNGIPVTSVRRTLLDLSGRKHPRAERALDQALRQEQTQLSQLWLLYEEEWTRGRRGIAILRAALIERTPGAAPRDSELEDMLARIIADAGLPTPHYQYPVELSFGRAHIDAAYPESRLAIECDGYAWHADRMAFDRDRERDTELQTLGWRVLRFTWAKLRWRQPYVADHIRHHLQPLP